ncbi:MAG: hypothetical protein PHG85_07120 [Candidatus Altiarchaeota archaeon]|nr:hypothetical protein [Candidatus Altiarchaeota archaeon]
MAHVPPKPRPSDGLRDERRLDGDIPVPSVWTFPKELVLPSFIDSAGIPPEKHAAVGRSALTDARGKTGEFRLIGCDPKAPVVIAPLRERALDYARQLGESGADIAYSTASAGPEFFAGFSEVANHFGGLKALEGLRIVELGGGRVVSALKPSLALREFGADVTIVDGGYPKSEGIFMKSDIRAFLKGLPDASIDAFLAFNSLEKGAGGDELYQRLFSSMVHPFRGDPAAVGRIKTLVKRMLNVAPGSTREKIFDQMTSKTDPGVRPEDFDAIFSSSVESRAYLKDVYRLMRKKLKRDGVAVILNKFDNQGLTEPDLRQAGFTVERVGHRDADPNDQVVLRTLRPSVGTAAVL